MKCARTSWLIAALDVTTFLLAPVQAANPYMVGALPDTQLYSQSYPATFHAQTQWIVDNRSEENIVFVTHEGDITQSWDVVAEWEVADAAMGLLDTVTSLPYAAVRGNRDAPSSYNTYFGASRYAGRSWFGGASGDGLNQWQTFDGSDGRTFLHLGLDFALPSDTVTWAQVVIDASPGMPTIITTHAYLGTRGNYKLNGQTIYDQLVHDNSQVFMVLCGHEAGVGQRQSTNAEGKVVFELLSDYQCEPNGGNGWMRLMTFKPDSNEIEVETYSPTLGQNMTDSENQFTLSMDFDARLGEIPETAADFDSDGDVDGDDFLAWQSSFGIDDGGDADFDGDTDGDDFLIWQSQFGSGSGSTSAAVPEPASIVLLIAAIVGAICLSQRH